MTTSVIFRRAFASWQIAAALTLAGGAAHAAPKPVFNSINSVSDILGVAHETDTRLVNPWGLAIGPEGNVHVSDDGTGFTTVYKPDGGLLSGSGVAVIPAAPLSTGSGSPTGIAENEAALLVASDTNDFDIASTTGTAPAHYIFGTEDGLIVGYRAIVDSTSGIVAVDNSLSGAGYTGVTLSWVKNGSGNLEHVLYAANFAQRKVDTFDSTFTSNTAALTTLASGSTPFVTPITTGTLPSTQVLNYSPFNVKAVDFYAPDAQGKKVLQRRILVAYALQSSTSTLNDYPAAGFGYVATFQPDGAFDRVLIPPGGQLNSPWGMAFSHHEFVDFRSPSAVLVGNHGDGTVNVYAFSPQLLPSEDGVFLGALKKDSDGNDLAFDGLWALRFGPAKISIKDYLETRAILDEDFKNLYFSAGIAGETHGLLGRIVIP